MFLLMSILIRAGIFFKNFSTKTYVVATQKNCLNEMVVLSTQNNVKIDAVCAWVKISNFLGTTVSPRDHLQILGDSLNLIVILPINLSTIFSHSFPRFIQASLHKIQGLFKDFSTVFKD